jgi:hypothetical protein
MVVNLDLNKSNIVNDVTVIKRTLIVDFVAKHNLL